MSSKPNTSPLVGIGVVIVAFMFAFLAEKDVVVWTIPFVVFFSFVAFKKWPTYSAKWSPTIYDKLFKR
jgi:type IV secretory pathway TrbL component